MTLLMLISNDRNMFKFKSADIRPVSCVENSVGAKHAYTCLREYILLLTYPPKCFELLFITRASDRCFDCTCNY